MGKRKKMKERKGFEGVTSNTDSTKKNKGSTKIETRQEMTKNLFHFCITLAWGLITPGIYEYTKEQNLFAHPLASP